MSDAMSGQSKGASDFIPQLDAVLEALADEIEAWADGLGIEMTYSDPVLEEEGSNEWAAWLRKESDWAVRTAGSLLTAQGKSDQAGDLKRRMEELYELADAYEQRLEALEDHRRVHIEGIVARYRQAFGNKDPDSARLGRLCQGIQRVWTFGFDDSELETPEDFAEAIDRAWFEEDGAKRRAQAEVKRLAMNVVEHLRLLTGIEAGGAKARESTAPVGPDTSTDTTCRTKRRKRGPGRMPLKQAWRYLTIVQEWAGIYERNQKLSMRDRFQKVQLAEKHGISIKELNAMLGWYAKHNREKRLPDDLRTVSKGELAKWFE